MRLHTSSLDEIANTFHLRLIDYAGVAGYVGQKAREHEESFSDKMDPEYGFWMRLAEVANLTHRSGSALARRLNLLTDLPDLEGWAPPVPYKMVALREGLCPACLEVEPTKATLPSDSNGQAHMLLKRLWLLNQHAGAYGSWMRIAMQQTDWPRDERFIRTFSVIDHSLEERTRSDSCMRNAFAAYDDWIRNPARPLTEDEWQVRVMIPPLETAGDFVFDRPLCTECEANRVPEMPFPTW